MPHAGFNTLAGAELRVDVAKRKFAVGQRRSPCQSGAAVTPNFGIPETSPNLSFLHMAGQVCSF